MNRETKQLELEQLRAKVRELEQELGEPSAVESDWPPRRFYPAYSVLTGFVLGSLEPSPVCFSTSLARRSSTRIRSSDPGLPHLSAGGTRLARGKRPRAGPRLHLLFR